MSLSSTSRPRDRFYIAFLLTYIPTILAFDCIPLYPVHLVPVALLDTHAWYKSFFNDQLAITLPAWFRFFFAIEACYELPLAIWGVYALSTKSPKAAPHLLVWALVCFGTTATCLFEFYENPLMSGSEKMVIIAIYGSYGLIFGAMAMDMFCRIQKTLVAVDRVMASRKAE